MIFNPQRLELSNVVAIDLETNGLNPRTNDALIISISTQDNTYVLGTGKYSKEFLTSLLKELQTCDVVIAHNAKFDASFLYYHYGITYTNWFCTMLASEILDNRPDAPSHSLVSTLDRYLGIAPSTSGTKKVMQRSFVGLKPDANLSLAQYKYAGEDTKYLIPLYKAKLRRAELFKLSTIVREENRLIPVLVKMEVDGCLIDAEGWRNEINTSWKKKKDELIHKLDAHIVTLSSKFPQLTGKFTRPRVTQELVMLDLFGEHRVVSNKNEGNLNYNSKDDVIELFEVLGVAPPKDKHDKVSVDENSLKTFVNENPTSDLIPFIEVLLEYREYNKLVSTYGEKFLQRLDENNHIHTSYTQCKTATGRLSSHNPNLQNIPSKGEGAKIRKFFIPRKGYTFITCDMSAAEVAIAADYSQEPLLLNALLKGEDMHSKLASVSFSIIFGENITITKSEEPITVNGYKFIPNDLRTAHKSVLFAKFYKAGAKRVYQVLAKYINLFHSPESRIDIATEISDALDKQMPKLTKYLSGVIKEANAKGYLVGSKLGRIRVFQDGAYGEAANFPIQNTNSEALKIAMIKIDDYFTENNYGRLVMNIHDEVVCEVLEERAEEAAIFIKNAMANSLSYFLTTVKGEATATIKPYWEK